MPEAGLTFTFGIEEEFFLVDPDTRDIIADPDPGIMERCERESGPHTVVPELLPLPGRDQHAGLLVHSGPAHGACRDAPAGRRIGGGPRRAGDGGLDASLRGLAGAAGDAEGALPRSRDGDAGGRAPFPGRRHAHSCRLRRPGFAPARDDGDPAPSAGVHRALGVLSLQRRRLHRLQGLPADHHRGAPAHRPSPPVRFAGRVRRPGGRLQAYRRHPGQQRDAHGHPPVPRLSDDRAQELRHLPAHGRVDGARRPLCRAAAPGCCGRTRRKDCRPSHLPKSSPRTAGWPNAMERSPLSAMWKAAGGSISRIVRRRWWRMSPGTPGPSVARRTSAGFRRSCTTVRRRDRQLERYELCRIEGADHREALCAVVDQVAGRDADRSGRTRLIDWPAGAGRRCGPQPIPVARS